MRVFWRALRNEATRMFTDPGALLLLVIAVVLYGLIYPVPYERQVLRDVPIAIVDEERGTLGRQVVRMVDAHRLTSVALVTRNLAEAERAVVDRRVDGIVILPTGLSEKVARGTVAEVLVVADATYFLIYKNVVAGALESVGTLSAGVQVRRLAASGMSMTQASAARAPIVADMRPLFNPIESYAAYVVPAVMIVILHQLLLIGIGLLEGTDYEAVASGRFPRARFDPADALLALLGRTIPYVLLFFVHIAFYFGTLLPMLELPVRAAPATLAAFLLPFVLATTWLAMAAGALFRTREGALAILFCTSMPVLFGTGFAWPPEAMGPLVAPVMAFVPAGPGVNGSLRLTQMAASLADVAIEWRRLWLLAGLFFVAAWLAEWRRVQPVAAASSDLSRSGSSPRGTARP